MINLIPPHARKQVKVEYWTRAISVWVFLAALGLLASAVVLLPSYILIQSQLRPYIADVGGASDSTATYAELEAAVASANKNAKELLLGEDAIQITTILREIELLATDAITIETIDVQRTDEGTIETFLVKGEANSRVELAEFRDAIEAHELFESAALPIANLAKDKDVPFRITITVQQHDA